MTVLFAVLIKTFLKEPRIHAAYSLNCDSGPGTM